MIVYEYIGVVTNYTSISPVIVIHWGKQPRKTGVQVFQKRRFGVNSTELNSEIASDPCSAPSASRR
jgi:hypothetical protein